MENPDPTKFISIEDHVAALQLQQAEFDAAISNLITPEKEKERLALIAEIEEKQARLAALDAPAE